MRRPTSCCPVAAVAVATAGRTGPTAGWCTAVIDLLVGDDRCGYGITAAFAMEGVPARRIDRAAEFDGRVLVVAADRLDDAARALTRQVPTVVIGRSEEHTSELQSLRHLVCRLLLEKKKTTMYN